MLQIVKVSSPTCKWAIRYLPFLSQSCLNILKETLLLSRIVTSALFLARPLNKPVNPHSGASVKSRPTARGPRPASRPAARRPAAHVMARGPAARPTITQRPGGALFADYFVQRYTRTHSQFCDCEGGKMSDGELSLHSIAISIIAIVFNPWTFLFNFVVRKHLILHTSSFQNPIAQKAPVLKWCKF